MRLEFGESHLDRVQIRRIGRQEEEPGTSAFQAVGSFGAFVNGEIVEDDDIARRERRGELGLDPEIEECPVKRLVDDPGRCQFVAAQAGDECLRSPMAEGSIGVQPFTARCTASEPHHLRIDRGLVNKDKAMRRKPHSGLTTVGP